YPFHSASAIASVDASGATSGIAGCFFVPRLSHPSLQKCPKHARDANPDADKQRAGRLDCSHPVGESSRLVGSRRWRGGRARFLHFELAKLEGQGDPLLGESFEFLVVGELGAHLRNKLRMSVAE